MNKDDFWKILSVTSDETNQLAAVKTRLDELTDREVGLFAAHFYAEYWRLNHYDAWAVAYVVIGGCSDDGFMDFRSWMVFQGEDACRKILSEPESLVDVLKRLRESEMESFTSFVSTYVDERGVEVPDLAGAPTRGPRQGENFDPDGLRERFPVLWEQFNQ